MPSQINYYSLRLDLVLESWGDYIRHTQKTSFDLYALPVSRSWSHLRVLVTTSNGALRLVRTVTVLVSPTSPGDNFKRHTGTHNGYKRNQKSESSTSIWPALLEVWRLLTRVVHVTPNLLHHLADHITHESASDRQACRLRVVESNILPSAQAAVAFAGTAHAGHGMAHSRR